MTHNDFIAKHTGKYLEFPGTGSALFQCLDLARQYIQDVWGLDAYIIPRSGSAWQAWNSAKSNDYIEKVYNTPNGIPPQGALVFWKYYPRLYGWAGHVAVYDKGDLYNIISFDQNYPTRTACHLQRHSYRGCLGWIVKK